MSAKFYTLLTDIGAAKLASATALGIPLKITQMAVGDGDGVLPTPNAQQTKLVAEKRRADLNMLYIDPQNSNQIIAEQVIPETEGGWWIREVGLFDETGALIAVGNCPESYKPQLAEGSGRTQTVRMVLITSSTDNITLKIDPAVVLATRKYMDDKVLELKVYVDDLMAKHLAVADPHTQYAPKDSPVLMGTPKVPTAPTGTNTAQIASTAFVQEVVTTLNNALAGKQSLDPTLTSLSGKSITGLLEYLQLREAAKLDVATNQQMQAGTATHLLPTVAAVMSLFSKRVFSTNDFIRIPDVPGGLIIQWGTTAGADVNGLIQTNLPTPFISNNGLCALCAYYSGSRNSVIAQVASITKTTIQFFASGIGGAPAANASLRYLVLGV